MEHALKKCAVGFYCKHCSKKVPKTTYYRHRPEFYNGVLINVEWCSVVCSQLLFKRLVGGVLFLCYVRSVVKRKGV